MEDNIQRFGNSLVQHGKYNDRVYLMKLSEKDPSKIIPKLDYIADDKKYSKIVAQVPEYAKENFQKKGYIDEAVVPNFYNEEQDMFFMGKYFSRKRKTIKNPQEANKILKVAKLKKNQKTDISLNPNFTYKIASPNDIPKLIDLFKTVFETYPFPIHDHNYILKTMSGNSIYFSVWDNEKIIAASSSEIDVKFQNAEMTHFAALPDYRGYGLATYLLKQMEEKMKTLNIKVAYSTARATSHAMNITFSKMGYEYGGTLVNNINICDNLESLNVWYKFL